jgi:uncharacterized membrane protein
MTLLILGLILFLVPHSVRIFADDWRSAQIARMGEPAWKGLYSLISILGFVLLVWGYGIARVTPVDLWTPPTWGRHLASLFTVLAFVLVAAAYVPRNRIRRAVGQPMVAGVTLWAIAHLLANGRLVDLVHCGAFLVWAVLSFGAAQRRERMAAAVRPAGALSGDLAAVLIGVSLWALFAFRLHGWLFGVRPFG